MSSIYDALKRIQGSSETQLFSAPPQGAPARGRSPGALALILAASLLCIAGVIVAVMVIGDKGEQALSRETVEAAVQAEQPAAASRGQTPAGLSADRQARYAPPGRVSGAGEGALAVEPEFRDVEEYLRQGEEHFRAGRYDRALAVYTQALRFSRKDARIMNNLGIVMLAKDQPEKAVSYFRQAGSLSPNAVEPVYNLACAYARLGETDQAIAHLKTACTMNPEAVSWAAGDPDLLVLKGTGEFDEIVGAQ